MVYEAKNNRWLGWLMSFSIIDIIIIIILIILSFLYLFLPGSFLSRNDCALECACGGVNKCTLST